jgi:hypothetical protein
MLHTIFAGTAFFVVLLGTAQNVAASDADVIRQFGMLGRQAIDCSAPYSGSNPYVIYEVTPTGGVTRTLKMTPEANGTFAMHNLRMVAPNVFQYDETGRQSEIMVSIVKQSDGTFRSWRTVRTSGPNKGEVLFNDGKRKDGSDTLAFTFCGR